MFIITGAYSYDCCLSYYMFIVTLIWT